MARFKSTLPTGEVFAFARWRELAAAEPGAWWIHGHGIGLRLRLDELTAVATAGQEGALDVRALTVLRGEAKVAIGQQAGFLRKRYEDLAGQLNTALGTDTLAPGGRAFGTVAAAARLLKESAYREALCDEIGGYAGTLQSFSDLRQLEELVELLDAELLYLGHSHAWRKGALEAAELAVGRGEPLGLALAQALQHAGTQADMEVVLAVETLAQPADVRVGFKRLDADQALTLVASWEAEIDAQHLEFPQGAVVIRIAGVTDPEAALARALEEFEIRRSVLRLQNGDVSVGATALIFDGKTAYIRARPVPINLLPAGITQFQEFVFRHDAGERPVEASILADAFSQLVQARSGPAGPAIADLWSVAEPLFSGVAGESGSGASDVMAGLAESLWVRELLGWLGDQYQALDVVPGATPRPGQSGADWALEVIATRTNDVLHAIDGDAAPLLLARTRLVLGWDSSRNLHADLARINQRFMAVGARAYLVRNLVVHRGQPQRARALTATLAPFAGLLRACLDYLARDFAQSGNVVPVTEARIANLRVRLVADDYAARRAQGPEPLRAAVDLT